MTDEAEETVVEDHFAKNLNDDQLLRCYIFENYASAEYEGHILVANMNAIYNWIRDAKVPRKTGDRSHLKTVSAESVQPADESGKNDPNSN